jgi:hypothetical protein
VDGLRTVAWFNYLRFHSSAAGLALIKTGRSGRELDPNVAAKKLRGYRLGRRTPSKELVEEVEGLCPGSRSVLEHVIWSVLRADRPVPRAKTSWISRLNPEIQRVIYRQTKGRPLDRTRWWRIDCTSEPMLERRAGLDSLAGFLALIRIAINGGDVDYAEGLSHYVCRLLLILAPTLYHWGILLSMFELVEREILDKIPLGWAFKNRRAGFISTLKHLYLMDAAINGDDKKILSPQQETKLRVELVDWAFRIGKLEELDSKRFTADNTCWHAIE